MRTLITLLLSTMVLAAQPNTFHDLAAMGAAMGVNESTPAPEGSPTPDILWYKFDEGSGTSAADSSAASRTGTVAADATWVTGASGGAFYLNGTADGTWTGNSVGNNTAHIGGADGQMLGGAYVSEVIFYNTALAAGDRANVENYLKFKYGL